MKKVVFVVGIICICVGILILNYFVKLGVSRKIEAVKVRLNWVNNAQFTGLYVAIEKGFYKNEGLNVNIEEFQDGLDQGKELTNNGVDYSIYTPVELLSDIAKGYNVKAIAAVYQTSPLIFVSLKSTNINTPKDFKGKLLSAKGDNFQAKLIYQTLANNYGVSSQSYKVTGLDFSMDEGDDLVKKRADMEDIYRTDQIYFFNQRNIAYNVMYPENFGFKSYGDTIATSDEKIAKDPDQVRRFIRATQMGWAYALAHQQEALSITKKYENDLYKDPQHEAYILSQSASLIQPTGENPIGTMSIEEWSSVVNAMKAEGLIPSHVDASTAY